jgi:hypothetical protein
MYLPSFSHEKPQQPLDPNTTTYADRLKRLHMCIPFPAFIYAHNFRYVPNKAFHVQIHIKYTNYRQKFFKYSFLAKPKVLHIAARNNRE